MNGANLVFRAGLLLVLLAAAATGTTQSTDAMSENDLSPAGGGEEARSYSHTILGEFGSKST